MKSKTTIALSRFALCAAPLMLIWGIVAAPAHAQDAATVRVHTPTPNEEKTPEGQIEQLVAPIALYPDSLLMQVLMASTYPLEVVEATRWSRDNRGIEGQALEDAMQTQSWDPSVKALTAVPQTLEMMNDKIDWMQQHGGAFGRGNEAAARDAFRDRADVPRDFIFKDGADIHRADPFRDHVDVERPDAFRMEGDVPRRIAPALSDRRDDEFRKNDGDRWVDRVMPERRDFVPPGDNASRPMRSHPLIFRAARRAGDGGFQLHRDKRHHA